MKDYTLDDLKRDIKEAKNIVYRAGIHTILDKKILVELNPRYTKYLGKCKYTGKDSCTIVLNKPYADFTTQEDIMLTLVHECLHACPQGSSHGKIWQSYASIIKKYNGMEITRLHPDTGGVKLYTTQRKQLIKEKCKEQGYKIVCDNCGWHSQNYIRKSKAYNAIYFNERGKTGYHCPHCSSKNLFISNNHN